MVVVMVVTVMVLQEVNHCGCGEHEFVLLSDWPYTVPIPLGISRAAPAPCYTT
jgi:hypothetical protein